VTGPVVGLFYDHWIRIRTVPNSFRNPLGLWKKAVWYRANPRSADYMKALLAERFPAATFVDVGSGPVAAHALLDASKIVLLFPDAIGLGYSPIERDVGRHAPLVSVDVLNGRKRQFAFDRRSRWAIRYRRGLEWMMLVECVMGGIIVIATPFLLLFDFARGRK
jgi:hypothetical protein